jgi:valyl-tRNA synthetase
MAKAQLAKAYDPHLVEDKWYRFWVERGYFALTPEAARPGAPGFCITIPPPNVTGTLHVGHALQHSIHDCIARWRRMCGDRVLVVPGTDHAAISTNVKVEQLLASEGTSRYEIGREAFVARCWEWTRHYGGRILEQLKALGCSYDWERTRFTLDPEYYRAVYEAFVRCYQRGWIYRGFRVVNWCPTCNSTVSDLEVEHITHSGHFWHVKYPTVGEDGFVIVATTRPETMLGDTAVAVHSKDPRYQHLHGKQVMLPLMNRVLPIITDDLLVDPEFGTGAVKVTPAHDLNDYEAGQRNNLPSIVVIGPDGKMTEQAKQYAGLDRYEARKRVLEDLQAQGLLVSEEDHEYQVGQHGTCHTVLEPLLSEQWFLRMQDLARMALDVIGGPGRRVEYVPDRFRSYTVDWLDNLRDWNISRQIWWGHRIPAYFCTRCDAVMAQVEPPEQCAACGGPVRQDEDTLDTWFSSALWPFAVLGWPEEGELAEAKGEGLYPTALMITARDILYLWIVRMVMTSLEFVGDIPFRQVLVHPTVLNLEGRRMSKSLGTGVDPLELIAQYGSDATRFSLLYQCGTDQDIRFGEERTEMARNFANKIWNASRFVLMNLGDGVGQASACPHTIPERIRREGTMAERWILSRYLAMLDTVDAGLARYEMADAARALYDFFWSEFCDWFVEMSKPGLRQGGETADRARQALWYMLANTLRVLHPFMPFITEEIWQQLGAGGESLMVAAWPEADPAWRDAEVEQEMGALMQVVVAARKLRTEQNLPPAQRVSIAVHAPSARTRAVIEANREAVLTLSRGGDLTLVAGGEPEQALVEVVHVFGEPALVAIAAEVSRQDLEGQRERMARELARLAEDEARAARKLSNQEFLARAPQSVVEKARAQHDELRERRTVLARQLDEIERSLSPR